MYNITLGEFRSNDEIEQSVLDVLRSGKISYGEYSREFEYRFANMHSRMYGVLSNSGTSSLLVALLAMKELYGWDEKSEVIVPSITFVATINAVLQAGLIPVTADVDPMTFNLDPEFMRKRIRENTVCVIPVHLFGLPANMTEICEIARSEGIHILEDSCEAVKATLWDRPVGSFGDVACFSTYVAHHVVTGVGGMAITNNIDLSLIMRSLVNHGIDVNNLPQGTRYDPTYLGRKFKFDRIGHSFRVTELESAIGLCQLDGINDNLMKRRTNAEHLKMTLQNTFSATKFKVRTQVVPEGYRHSWMVFPVVIENLSMDLGVFRRMMGDAGIETRTAMPLINQPCYDDLVILGTKGFVRSWYPIADFMLDRSFYVGCHPGLSINDMEYIASTMANILL